MTTEDGNATRRRQADIGFLKRMFKETAGIDITFVDAGGELCKANEKCDEEEVE